ncbi:hypothetical protein GCM10028807_16120 [Spirosoma daeguense]
MLEKIAEYLFNRREPLLNNWRARCSEDPTLSVLDNMTREEFNDRIPILLNILDQRMRQVAEEADASKKAGEHGLHRWHKGYALVDVLTELAHLHNAINDEIGKFASFQEQTLVGVIHEAHRTVASLIQNIIRGSILQFNKLQQVAAVERSANLQRVIDELNELSRQRGEYLRGAAHDLRGNMGIITGAVSLMEQENADDSDREQMLEMLQRNAVQATGLLTELMDLARLEAGEEMLDITRFDASELIRNVVHNSQPLIAGRNIILQADGPESLMIQGDAVKLQRIVQNLIGNAFRNTRSGPISVTWLHDNQTRWLLSVQDSSSGLPPGAAVWLSEALKPAHETTGVLYGSDREPAPIEPGPVPLASTGESVGLFVVKKLCELLNASMDVDTRSSNGGGPAGTIFRIRFPVDYGVELI